VDKAHFHYSGGLIYDKVLSLLRKAVLGVDFTICVLTGILERSIIRCYPQKYYSTALMYRLQRWIEIIKQF
jgi:hypothetical protein